jgi:hypothetical protein
VHETIKLRLRITKVFRHLEREACFSAVVMETSLNVVVYVALIRILCDLNRNLPAARGKSEFMFSKI